ncbi:hypothetical protein TWF703_006847 [Orbilia oligospora]|uniref:AAA+ ATPase domain-containing protein n=1 Tax=Orbilia oligospora TaxID=2813651 RepID=A0A7C8JW22_ORBOL|nr:hypothetical protein TWF703_006847 [Orbilia oligospora]
MPPSAPRRSSRGGSGGSGGKARRTAPSGRSDPAPSNPPVQTDPITPSVPDDSERRTLPPNSRLLPNLSLEIFNGSNLERSRAFVQRFCEGQVKISSPEVARNFLRAVIRQSGQGNTLETCISTLGDSVHGVFAIVEALNQHENLKDISFLNNYVGQLFLFLTYQVDTNAPGADVNSFDDHIRRIIGRIVEDNDILFRYLTRAAIHGKLGSDAMEGLARLIICYLNFAPKVPDHIQRIIINRKFIGKLMAATHAGVQSIGTTLKYWWDCDSQQRADHTGKYVAGGRHDNDFRDYRKIKIIPTADEFSCLEPSYLPKSTAPANQKGDSRVGLHLDTQFRLLREEMLNEIRADYYDCISGKGTGIKPNNTSERPKLTLKNLQWDDWDFQGARKLRRFGIRLLLPEGFSKYVNFGGKNYDKLLADDQSFPFKNNQLAILVVDDEIVGFGKLARDVESLREPTPAIIFTLEDTDVVSQVIKKLWDAVVARDEGEPDIKLVCVDSPVYAHEPILKRLQTMRAIPLAKELLHFEKGKEIGKTSFHPEELIPNINPETPLKDHVRAGTDSITMDRAQCVAIKRALQNKVALIQGPPGKEPSSHPLNFEQTLIFLNAGTGKTMVGNIIAKLLYLYTPESIVVITQQNHICDEFLENLLAMGVRTEHVVRLGSQYSDATRPVTVNELSDESYLFKSVKNAMDSIKIHIDAAWNLVNEAIQELFVKPMTWEHIRQIAIRYNEANVREPEDRFGYISAFTVPEGWGKVVLEADPKCIILTNDELFELWAENAQCPTGMENYLTEDGRELWDMPPEDRDILLGWFREALVADQIAGLVSAVTNFNHQVDEFNRWKDTRLRYLFKEKRIIAATTNGAAKYLPIIADTAPKILIVEEAAQILESHVLAALHDKVEQIIMIGDHNQLRPRCETWEFQHDSERGYNLDISLFERLVKEGFPCDVLETQHRARPEISQIIRTLTYPNLKDHKSVHRLDRIRGLQRSVTWMAHQYQESSADKLVIRNTKMAKKSSKINEFEADMVVSLVRYLGLQGYANDHIVVITPYLAQVGLITKKMKERGECDVLLSQGDYHELVRAGIMEARDLKGVNKYIEVCTVDQFQGSDRDIVIVSTVRCNTERKASFLRAPERANVLLSRARKALIIIGDLYSVTDHGIPGTDSIWRNVFTHFKSEGHIFDGIPIVCQNHPKQKRICRTPEELDFCAPEGRCRLLCESPLPCGKHTCSFFCHGGPDHSRMECRVMEKKTCSKGHEWDDFCWPKDPKPCEKCSMIDARFKSMQEEEEARKTKEFETSYAAEVKSLKQAEEANKKMEAERQDKLNFVREQRLIAERKVDPKPRRMPPPIKPFGEAAELLAKKERAERMATELAALDHRILEAEKTASQQASPMNLGLRPLRVADLKQKYSGGSSVVEAGRNASEDSQESTIPARFRVPGIPISNHPITLVSSGVLDKGSDSEIMFEVNIQAPKPRPRKRLTGRSGDNSSLAQTPNRAQSDQSFPSSPPIRITPLADDSKKFQQLEATPPTNREKSLIEEASEMNVLKSVAKRLVVEEPPSFVEEVPQTENFSTTIVDSTIVNINGSIVGSDISEIPAANGILLPPSTLIDRVNSPKSAQSDNIVLPKVPDTIEIVPTLTILGSNFIKSSRSSKASSTSSNSNPFTVPLTPFDGPFPSPSRDEWKRHKLSTKDSNAALDQIMDMIGMEHVKEQVLAIKAKVDTVHRQEINLRGERFHVALLGNPGTGKTTFARSYANFLRSEGVLEGLSYVETTGARLAHDGINGLRDIFSQLLNAKGGTLFIDEAYQLVTSGALEGRQVLDFLLSEMERHLGKIIVIISGYNKEMEKFFEHNPGLHSRIPYRIQFEDFTNEELLYILQDTIKGKFGERMKIEDGYSGLYMRITAKRLGRMRGMHGCGNARGVQNAVAKILERQAARVTKERKQGFDADDFLLTKEDVIGPAPSQAAMESETWKELHQLIGLGAVKQSVMVLLKRMESNYQRELAEEKPIDVSLNRVFLGSPGTGKTSVAKIYGKILAQLGLLSSGEVIMKTPSDFLGRALGESEANTKAILNASRGKVLIIDEAYMFNPKLNGAEDPYKSAVIDTIVSEVQNVPGDDQCVLLLGYKEDLEKMFNAVNPGLSRRFPISDGFVFEDFTDIELSKILDLKLRLAEIHATPESREVAIRKIGQRRQKVNFGNAGEVENLLNVAKERMLKRHVDGGDSAAELLPTDFDPDHDRGNRTDPGLADLFKDLIGVEDVIRRFEEYQMSSMVMRGRGVDPKDHIPLLFIFKGPPGTGKTTTARKMGQIFYNMGFLASNEVIECSASDLVAEYVGQTAHRTRKKLEQGLGKVLFIDEAYRLQDNQYGIEASNELVDAVTKPKFMGNLVIILAGYDDGIDNLLALNVGLASRFSEVIEFPDVNYHTAIEIVKTEVKKAGVDIPSFDDKDSDQYAEILELLKEISETRGWGHARDAQNLAKGMTNKAYRSVKSLHDSVAITHEIAVSVLVDMLKQRKGRAFVLPVFKPKPALPPPKVQYAEPVEAPQVKVNIEIEKAPEAAKVTEIEKPVPAESVIKIITKTEPVIDEAVTSEPVAEPVAKRGRKRSSLKKTNGKATTQTSSEDTSGRERGTTNQNWEALSQSRTIEEARITQHKRRQSELRQSLEVAQREKLDAGAKYTTIKLQYFGKRAPVFKQRIEAAKLKEAEAQEMIAKIEKEIEDIAQDEKAREAREKINMTKLDKMGLCPKKYHWIKMKDGYRCAGGEHSITNEELNAYSL